MAYKGYMKDKSRTREIYDQIDPKLKPEFVFDLKLDEYFEKEEIISLVQDLIQSGSIEYSCLLILNYNLIEDFS